MAHGPDLVLNKKISMVLVRYCKVEKEPGKDLKEELEQGPGC